MLGLKTKNRLIDNLKLSLTVAKLVDGFDLEYFVVDFHDGC